MEFDYTVTTTKTFDEAVQSVQDETIKAGMVFLYVHDVQQLLGEKGFKREPFKVIDICYAKFVNACLDEDIRVGLFLPCKINVYTKDGKIFISGLRPIAIAQFFPQANFGDHPKEVDQLIQNIINNAK